MNSIMNRRPVGQLIWKGCGTVNEMRNLCRELKQRNLMDQSANETFRPLSEHSLVGGERRRNKEEIQKATDVLARWPLTIRGT